MAKRKKKKAAAQKERINAADVVAVYDELDRLREQYPEAAEQVNPKYNKKRSRSGCLAFTSPCGSVFTLKHRSTAGSICGCICLDCLESTIFTRSTGSRACSIWSHAGHASAPV